MTPQPGRWFAWILLVLLVNATGCTVTPQQELQLGAESHAQFEKEGGGAYPDAQVQGYVSGIGMQMAHHAGRPDMNWQFKVLNANDINAFAVPGGYIYITQGLLFKMQNEAQLAGVLGHEAGHIAGRHSAKAMQTSQTVGLVTAGVGVLAEQTGYAMAGQLGSLTSQLYLLRYSREHETEADYLGLKYMTQAGYNPNGMVEVMQILKTASGGEGGGLAEWTSTHPDTGNRIEYLTQAIKEKYTAFTKNGKLGQAEFQQNVLSRRQSAASGWRLPSISPVDPDRPALWCAYCRAAGRKAVAQSTFSASEMLKDVH